MASAQRESTAGRDPRSKELATGFVTPLVLAALAICGFFVYPGHTFLGSDSQIFMPVLLHRLNPALFTRDILIKSVHTTYTVWDELALGLYRITGLQLESVLFLLQIVFRFTGLLGVFWLLQAVFAGLDTRPEPQNGRFSRWLALAGAAVYGLGAFVPGPTLLTIEYEPVPRAFSLPLVLLGLGFIARGRFVAAGVAGACAYLMHPPTSLAFWGVYLLAALVHTEDERRWHGLALLPVAGVVLQVFAWLEPLPAEMQTFFERIDPAWEKLQRLRAPYVFPSDWLPSVYWVNVCLFVLIALAYVRLRHSLVTPLRTFIWALPAVGLVSIPATWLLLEKVKWSLMPQLQPMRYTLYVVLFGIVLGYAAGVSQAARRRYVEAGLWFLAAFSVAFQNLNLLWITPLLLAVNVACGAQRFLHANGRAFRRWSETLGFLAGVPFAAAVIWRKPFGLAAWASPNLKLVAACAAFALLLVLLTAAGKRLPAIAPACAVLFAVGLLFAAPRVARPASQELRQGDIRLLSAWALHATPQDSVFLFPDAGRSLEPGVFRYYAERNVFADWKGGGQVNYFHAFGDEWWQRWQVAGEGRYSAAKAGQYPRLGINFLVFKKPPARLPGPIVYHDNTYTVVALPRI